MVPFIINKKDKISLLSKNDMITWTFRKKWDVCVALGHTGISINVLDLGFIILYRIIVINYSNYLTIEYDFKQFM